jgi:hypothetical protein
MRLARIPTGNFFGRDPFAMGQAVSPDQKAQYLISLIEGSPLEQKYRKEINECMEKWNEARALRRQSGGWGKLEHMMAPSEALACLQGIEARISSQLRGQ